MCLSVTFLQIWRLRCLSLYAIEYFIAKGQSKATDKGKVSYSFVHLVTFFNKWMSAVCQALGCRCKDGLVVYGTINQEIRKEEKQVRGEGGDNKLELNPIFRRLWTWWIVASGRISKLRCIQYMAVYRNLKLKCSGIETHVLESTQRWWLKPWNWMRSLCSELRMVSWKKHFEGLSWRENESIEGDREEVRQVSSGTVLGGRENVYVQLVERAHLVLLIWDNKSIGASRGGHFSNIHSLPWCFTSACGL